MAIIDVVKWDATPDTFAWKFPENNLSTKTQLIVHQSQEAILFSKGKLMAKFDAGKHTLSTENIPILRELYGIPFGGVNPFTAEVWFINKVEVLDIKWGTPQPLQIRDPEFNLVVPVRAFGQFGISIIDSEKFLLKLVGTLPRFNREDISNYFKGLLIANATAAIAKKITNDKISTIDLPAQTLVISDYLCEALTEKFDSYGISVSNFYINSLSLPEDDETVKRLKSMLAKKAEMSMLGYNYQQERSYDVMDKAADNPGMMGEVMGAGMGLGMGLGMGNIMASMMNNLGGNLSGNLNSPQVPCKACKQLINPNARFCPHCGHSDADSSQATANQVIKCDKCGAIIPPDAKFCNNCGDAYNKCPYCNGDIDPAATICPLCNKELPFLCVKCNTPVPEDAKFCPQCGTSVQKQCVCGAVNNPKAKFCAECGNKLL